MGLSNEFFSSDYIVGAEKLLPLFRLIYKGYGVGTNHVYSLKEIQC